MTTTKKPTGKQKPTAKTVTAKKNAKKTSAKNPAKTKASTKSTKAKSTAKRKRLPVSAVRVRAAAIASPTMAEAEAVLKIKKPLAEILALHSVLHAAWERGRFLKNIQQLAATAATITEACEALSLEPGTLDEMLKSDIEVADIWKEARTATIIKIKTARVDSAIGGNATAAKQVEAILRREIVHPAVDFTHLTTDQMISITGKSRQTIHDWQTKYSMPRNSDKSFNLASFIVWFEGYVFKKADNGSGPAVVKLDPLRQSKADELQMRLDKQRGQLLDRGMVIAGMVARHQSLVSSLDRKSEQLSLACVGKPQPQIASVLDDFFSQVRDSMCQVPETLRLSADHARQLSNLLEDLKPKGSDG